MEKFAQILRTRKVKRVVHCHADHFEPFRQDRGGNTIGLDHIQHWLTETAKLPFAKNASLFFLERLFVRPGKATATTPIPEILAPDSTHGKPTLEALKVLCAYPRDMHVHIHHEFWTSGPLTGWPVDSDRDADILRHYIHNLKALYDTIDPGIFKDWLFVHGCWALNASDRNICQITDEIRVLQEFGCRGDMSFPAGRPHCDPDMKMPFTVMPNNAPKGYNDPAAEAIRADAPGAFSNNRFFIWSSAVETHNVSLDMIATNDVQPLNAVRDWVENSCVFKNTLFLKTHAHSLWYEHWKSSTETISPFLSAPVQASFAFLEQACATAQIPIEYKTVRAVVQELRGD